MKENKVVYSGEELEQGELVDIKFKDTVRSAKIM